MKKILVAVDGSSESYRAARFARDLAVSLGASLTLVHAIPPLLVSSTELMDDVDGAAEELLRAMADRLEETRLPIEKVLLHGSPAEAVAKLAEEGGFDLVAVGTRGRNGAARVLLGSVSDRLAHICDKPVVVVR